MICAIICHNAPFCLSNERYEQRKKEPRFLIAAVAYIVRNLIDVKSSFYLCIAIPEKICLLRCI